MIDLRVSVILVPILLMAFVLHLITLKHHALEDKELAKAGKRLIAAGLLIAILRFTLIPYYPVAVLGLVLIGMGSVFSCLERICEMIIRLRARDSFGESLASTRRDVRVNRTV